jgi:hypothetical protein
VNARKASGRHTGGNQFAIKLGGNESGPEDLGFALVRCGLHIQRQKSVKNVVMWVDLFAYGKNPVEFDRFIVEPLPGKVSRFFHFDLLGVVQTTSGLGTVKVLPSPVVGFKYATLLVPASASLAVGTGL